MTMDSLFYYQQKGKRTTNTLRNNISQFAVGFK